MSAAEIGFVPCEDLPGAASCTECAALVPDAEEHQRLHRTWHETQAAANELAELVARAHVVGLSEVIGL